MATTSRTHNSSSCLLLCEEDSTSLDDASSSYSSPPPPHHVTTICSHTQDDEYIQQLTSRERSTVVHKLDASSSLNSIDDREWLCSLRSDSVRWIVKERQRFGFSLQTAYLAVAYLDIFLARTNVERRQIWVMKLLTLSCLSLAAKLEECQVPILSKFEVEDYHFDGRSIQRMELVILTALEWKLRLITPFPYLHYLVSRLRGHLQRPREVLIEASRIIFAAIESMSSIDRRPSVLAMAAFFAARGCGLTKETLLSDAGAIPACGSFDAEHVISFYDKIQELQREHKTTVAINDKPSVVPSIRNKRRRLSFDVENCSCLICNKDGSV